MVERYIKIDQIAINLNQVLRVEQDTSNWQNNHYIIYFTNGTQQNYYDSRDIIDLLTKPKEYDKILKKLKKIEEMIRYHPDQVNMQALIEKFNLLREQLT